MIVPDTPSSAAGAQSRHASSQPALVYLFSGIDGLDGELNAAQRLRSEAAKTGNKVIIIGDGQHFLSSDEVQAGFAHVKGDYNLVIGTHGIADNGSLRMSFLPPGDDLQSAVAKRTEILKAHGATDVMLQNPNDPNVAVLTDKYQNELNRVSFATAGNVFKMLPPGVKSVITSACDGEAIRDDTRYLPNGVPVFSVSVGNMPAWANDVVRGYQGITANIGKIPNPTDIYLNYIVNGFDEISAKRQLQMSQKLSVLPSTSEVLPSEIMIAKKQSINLLSPIANRTPMLISAASVDRITNIVMAGGHDQTFGGTAPDGKPILDESGKLKPLAFTRDAVRAEIQNVADALARGDLKPERPLMMYKDSSSAIYNSTTERFKTLHNAQVAVGLVGAEIDARAKANNMDLTQAYNSLTAPSVPAKPVLGGNRAGLRTTVTSPPAQQIQQKPLQARSVYPTPHM